jgi:GGDEF domain-containing protein
MDFSLLLNEISSQFGSAEDFVGHAGGENFVMVTQETNNARIVDELKNRFNEEILTHYNFTDRDQGFISLMLDGVEEQHALMTLSIGSVSPSQYRFSDIREITEIAADERKKHG